MSIVGLIPARLQSTRLPRKLLLAETGRPLIQHTWESVARAKLLDEVIVATDSPEIARTVASFGGRAELTGEHPSGTDRIAEVTRRCCPDASVIVNVQGDEPELDPDQIDSLVQTLQQHPQADMATLSTGIDDLRTLHDPSCTKVVTSAAGRALYFSRLPIPFSRDRDAADVLREPDSVWRLHLGIYAYRRDYLLQLADRPPSRLEQLEKLEQLRALESGGTIQVAQVAHRSVGIDTPEDYSRFVERQQRRAA